ncbi:MAG: LapA family protein [Melioribacteraceae bacterium]|nr:LapA family protein [Melioribacteraceae bacterium]
MNIQSFKLSTSLVLIVLATIFLIQNTQVVQINIIFWTISMSTAIMVVLLLVSGILIGWFLNGYLSNKKSKDSNQN